MFYSFETYPYTNNKLKKYELENRTEEIDWLPLTNFEEAFETVLKTYQDLTSENIPLIHAARERVNQEYKVIGNGLHVFSKEEARHQLGMTNDDVTRLFSKVELGGARLTF